MGLNCPNGHCSEGFSPRTVSGAAAVFAREVTAQAHACGPPVWLGRERVKAPYSKEEIASYLLAMDLHPSDRGTQGTHHPLRADSIALTLDHPEVLAPPEHPPTCCTQVTITVPPQVNAKTAQRHDYTSKPWRCSYARRSAAERSNARIRDPATVDVARGWCRVMGLTPMSLFITCALVVRNLAVADAFSERQADSERRMAAGLSPKTRRRRRRTLGDLVAAGSANAPPWSPASRRHRVVQHPARPGNAHRGAGRCPCPQPGQSQPPATTNVKMGEV